MSATKYLSNRDLGDYISVTRELDTFLSYYAKGIINCSLELNNLSLYYYPRAKAIAYVGSDFVFSGYKQLEEDTPGKIIVLHKDEVALKDYLDSLKVHEAAELSSYINSLNVSTLRELLFKALTKEK